MFTQGINPAAAATIGATGGLGAEAPTTGGAGGSGLLAALFGGPLSGLFGGAIGGGANLLSLLLGGRGEQRGFGDIESQLQQALAGERGAIGTALGGLAPFQQAGQAATGQELAMLQAGADPTAQVSRILGAFQQSPAQKATIEAGLSAVQNRLQAQGIGQSGAQQKALEQFAQTGTAGQQQQFLQSVLGARGQTLGGLGGLGQLGLGAAGQMGQLGLRGQEDISSLLQSLGMTQFGAEQAGGQRQAGIIGSIADLLKGIL